MYIHNQSAALSISISLVFFEDVHYFSFIRHYLALSGRLLAELHRHIHALNE